MKPVGQPLFTDESARRDAAWVAAVLAGDRDAFGKLVRAYERVAVATAYRLLNNSADAQEVTQDAFLKAYRALSRLKDPRRFGPWLLRIVSNLSLNARRSRRSGIVALDEQQGLDEAAGGREVANSTTEPDHEAIGRELQARIDVALEQLPEKQRMALVLFTVEEWPQKDIAELLNCSIETVKWNVFRARQRLKEQLGDDLAGT
ncbi:MAG TPA: sigma-70 family RNA polymerase sigma factor [Phycisphaerae bacterium]|nr:sigma-70 family RNA polymerase sigma factor [Phycisphaerae bacterium]